MVLKEKAIKGIKWSGLQSLLIGLSGPFLQIFKAKFLSPEDFALIAVVTFVLGFHDKFANFGLNSAMIKEELNDRQKNSIFIFVFSLTWVVFIAFNALVPFIVKIFYFPNLDPILRLCGIIIIIKGTKPFFNSLLQKELLIKEVTVIKLGRQILLIFFTILFLIFGYGVYGVLFGKIISNLFSTFCLFFLAIKKQLFKIKIRFVLKDITSLIKFGLFVTSRQLLIYFAVRIDELIIGYFFSQEILGFYYFAKNMMEKLRILITNSFKGVLFPFFSKIKNSKNMLKNSYLQISRYIAFLSFPVFFGIFITSEMFVPLIFGAQWQSSIVFFEIFSLLFIFNVLSLNLSGPLLYSRGKADIAFWIEFYISLLYFVFLVFAGMTSISLVILVYSIYIILKSVTYQIYVCKELNQTFYNYLKIFKKELTFSLFMVMGILVFRFIFSLDDFWMFFFSVLNGFLIYSTLAFFYSPEIILGLKNVLIKNKTSEKISKK